MNDTLPIKAYKAEILEAVKNNPVVLITAETGAGKSTQVPQYLLEAGYDLVVTQPRRLAARNLAQRVAVENGTELGQIIGFRTAYEYKDSAETRCLFVTDGLALVRELMGNRRHQLLVLDEVHEWNLNIEVLCAWARLRIEESSDFKLVVMSATMESEKLAAYFNAPVIQVPGRLFPVTEQAPKRSIAEDAADLLHGGRNVLVFQPGKAEIKETAEELRQVLGTNAEILELHGELSAEEQQKCFRNYTRPKCVISTNVAQTSITIDDIDAVIDSGVERRVELVDGVEGLYLRPISLADREQRRGRAGRTRPGIYIDWCPSAQREEFPVAEILRTRLDQVVLRLAQIGFDAATLEFFHQPPHEQLMDAKRMLHVLGCVIDGKVTKKGARVAALPVSVQYGCMVVEAERLGVVDDAITIAAILEQGEITQRPRRGERNKWLGLVRAETESDVLAQLAVYNAAKNMDRNTMNANGIFIKAFYQAKEKRRHLAAALRNKIEFKNTGGRTELIRSICAGMLDHLYENRWGRFVDNNGDVRELAQNSLVRGSKWVVGQPWDLQVKARYGVRTIRMIRMVTNVDPVWLAELAPWLVQTTTGHDPKYNYGVVSTTRQYFNGQLIAETEVNDPGHPEARIVMVQYLMHDRTGRCSEVTLANDIQQNRVRELNKRQHKFHVMDSAELMAHYSRRLGDKTPDTVDPEDLRLPPINEDLVLRDHPDTLRICGRDVEVRYTDFWGEPLQQPEVVLNLDELYQVSDIKLPNGRAVLVCCESVKGTVQYCRDQLKARRNQPKTRHKPEPLKVQATLTGVEALKAKFNRR